MWKNLTVAEYDRAEQEAISGLPNRIIEAYQPKLFREIGYPASVGHERELWKYVDAMHEGRFENDFSNLLGRLSDEEFGILRQSAELSYRFSETKFGRKIVARSSALRNLNVFRHIRYVFEDRRPRVFEIGPGSGYLGAMLFLNKYPYAATDVAQAFYLYQNGFWNFISGDSVIELAAKNGEAPLTVPADGILHIPWWEFVKLRPESAPNFDVVTCNHALAEMHPDSLRFALKLARGMLGHDGGEKCFIFEGWGWERHMKRSAIIELFYQNDFEPVHDDRLITVFVPVKNMGASAKVIKILSRFDRIYGFKRAREILQVARVLSRFDRLRGFKRIVEKRRSHLNSRTVGIEEVNSFYTKLLDGADHLTPDERFWKLIGRPLG